MAVTPRTGFKAQFRMMTDTTTVTSYTSGTTIGGLVDFTPNFDIGEADVSSTEDADEWSTFIPTRRQGTIQMTVRFDPDASEHQARVLDLIGQTRRWFFTWSDVNATDTTSRSVMYGMGFFTNVAPSGGHDTPIDCGITMRIKGTPTFAGL